MALAPERASPTKGPAEAAHAEIWRRFVTADHGTLLHYAGLNGEVVLPTPEDCEAARPNGMSWSTPIEDGPFFGGLYLAALCQRWQVLRTPEAAKSARRIAGGLVKLAKVGQTPGFVARGLASDGRSHYPASSEDQFFPWLYGLWHFVKSDLPSETEKREVHALMEKHVLAVEEHQWRVPCDPPAFGFRGDFLRPKATDAARLLFIHRIMHTLTGQERWRLRYRELAQEKVGKVPRSRLEWCAAGLALDPPEVGESFLWTSSMSQAALRTLWKTEEDPQWKKAYAQGLSATARAAVPHLARRYKYRRDNKSTFDIDWRFLNQHWIAQADCDAAIQLARTQLPKWAEHSPRSPWEDDCMREPLFAAWMISLSADDDVMAETYSRVTELLSTYEWGGLYTSLFFIAVAVHYQTELHHLE
ncbi:hypothetical protein [Verrucomicrobium sp. BvORR034]|uniref:hypothetical protein n=1 Tax=Verrucomicrobium sp. BvORR034 TaxID=1396418 RepID=UPI000678653C|nr:hypothetical protein [Verrucomicrobium sp. BvORR034]